MRRLLALNLVMFLMIFSWSCGGDGGEDEEEEDNGPVQGEVVLGEEGVNYMMPHIAMIDSQYHLVYRTDTDVFARQLEGDTELKVVMDGVSLGNYAINQYLVNENYFVWNPGASAKTFRYRWRDSKAEAGFTEVPVPGFCIYEASRGQELVFITGSGDLKTPLLYDISNIAEMDNLTALHIKAASFACEGLKAWVSTTDGTLYFVPRADSNPELEEIASGAGRQYNLITFSDPYLLWVDEAGDIWVYNTSTKEEPKILFDVDPVRTASQNPVDMRVFGTIVVWSDDSEGSFDIWAGDIVKALADPAYEYVQVTNEAHDQRYPYISNGMIFWQDNRDEDWQIWKAELGEI